MQGKKDVLKDFAGVILEGISESIMLLSKEFTIIYSNTSLIKSVKMPLKEVIGSPCYRITHHLDEPCSPPHHPCPLTEVMKTGSPCARLHTHLDKNGNRRYVEVSVYPLKDENGDIQRFIHISRDITQMIKSEKSIQEEEEKYRKLTESISDVFFALDRDLNYTYWNRASEKLTGIRAEDAIGKNLFEVFPDARETVIGKIYKEAIETGKQTTLTEIKFENENVKGFFDIEVYPTTDGISVFVKDVTKRKTAEDTLMNYSKKLEESNRLKDLFTDIMHHDMLNPASIIFLKTETMLEDNDPEDVTDGLKLILRQAERIIEMIENASMYAKLQTIDKLEFEREDINKYIQDAILSNENMQKEKDIEVIFKPKGKQLTDLNPSIETVFVNLISNAIKYSPENSKIIIDVKDEKDRYKISIADNGIGIMDEDKEKIFDRFERVKNTGVKGTGLGLAIVKKCVLLHRGDVWVEDNPDGGSIFNVVLPKLPGI